MFKATQDFASSRMSRPSPAKKIGGSSTDGGFSIRRDRRIALHDVDKSTNKRKKNKCGRILTAENAKKNVGYYSLKDYLQKILTQRLLKKDFYRKARRECKGRKESKNL
ncbi:MAG: hypothetical protein PHU71_06935 [Candidatus Gracilibacteria bacterium]|nr:hypothetical protein [Candidatus Gracilibacteria bacterium]